jgi:YHS domain-containing protein
MPVDIVCGMEVSAGTRFKTVYKGKIYYFCSDVCRRVFEKNPNYYLEHGPIGRMPEEG